MYAQGIREGADLPDPVSGWIESARTGRDRESLGQALEAYRQYLLLIAGQELDAELAVKGGASDLVQETFLDAQRGFEQFEGRTEGELRAWLRTVLLNNLANHRRRYETDGRRLDREVRLDGSGAGPPLPARDDSPSRVAIRRELAEALREALTRLPERYRRVLTLRHQERHPFDAIGQAMGLSPDATRALWARAIKRLRAEIDDGTRQTLAGGGISA